MGNNMFTTFSEFLTRDSLFQKMVEMGAPWDSEIATSMDFSFFTMYSWLKTPSYFVRMNVNSDSVVNSNLLAKTLWDMYGRNWKHLWNGFVAEYSPLENYSIQETIKRDESNQRVIGKKGSTSSSVDETDSGSTTSTGSSSLKYGHVLDTTADSNGNQKKNDTVTLEHGHVVDTTDNLDVTEKVEASSSITFGHVIDTTIGSTKTEESSDKSSLQHGEVISRTSNGDSFTFAFNSTAKTPTASQTQTGSDTHSGTDVTTTSGTVTTTLDETQKQINSGKDDTESTSTTTKNNVDTLKQTNSGSDVTTTNSDITTGENSTEKQTNSGTDVTTTEDDTEESFEIKRTTQGTSTEDTTDDDTINENISRVRSGNVGQHSYQDLLKQQFELWKWNFYYQVFDDCDKFLCLSVFDTCQIP